ncbi:GumC family protein [Candidatus Latescibacterota bacterium]
MNNDRIQNIELNDEGITFKELVGIVSKYRYLIGLIIFITLLLSTVYLLVSEPVYEASGQLLIESQRSSLLEESLGFPGSSSPVILNTTVERIMGRSITDSVIVKTNSFVVMKKEALDFIDYLASSPPDSIKIFNIVLSRNSNDNNDSDYRVFDSNGNLLASGFFGKKLILKNFSIVLNSSIPGKKYKIEILPIRFAREIISNNLNVSNIRNTNIIQFSYRHVSPLRAKQVIDGYITEFLKLNLLEKREEVTTRKNFLEDQFEKISTQLQDTANDYKEFKLTRGFVALDEQTTQYIERLGTLEKERVDYEIRITEASAIKKQSEKVLSGDPELQEYIKLTSSPFFQENTILQGLYSTIAELQVQNAKLRAEYNPSHPIMLQNETELEAARKQLEKATSVTIANATKGVDPLLRPVVENLVINHININVYDRVLNQIKSEIGKFDTIMKSLPEVEVEQLQLERRMRIDEQIYNLLLSRLQEARIMEATTIGDVRVVNTAELPQVPVAPNKKKVLLIALLAGLFVSGSVVFASEEFKTSFSTIESIERECGTPVVSIIPHLTKGRKGKREIVIGFEKKEDHWKLHGFELFNTLRLNLMFSDSFQKSKTLVVTSSMPREGKSFVSANLAVTMAHAGMKVLLVDCDFRHPNQDSFF